MSRPTEFLLIVGDQPVATMLNTAENHLFLASHFQMLYLGSTNQYQKYKITL